MHMMIRNSLNILFLAWMVLSASLVHSSDLSLVPSSDTTVYPRRYIMPYAGYIALKSGYPAMEMGGRYGVDLSNQWGVAVGLDWVSTLSDRRGSHRLDIFKYTLNGVYYPSYVLLPKHPQLRSFVAGGVAADMSNFGSGFDLHIHPGLIYPISGDRFLQASVVIGNDVAFRLGIQKYLASPPPSLVAIAPPEPPAPVIIEPPALPTPPIIPTPPIVVEPKVVTPIELARLTLTDALYQFDMQRPTLVDMTTHWAKEDAEYAVSVGLMNANAKKQFNLAQNVTHGDMTKMVVYASYLHRLRAQMAMDIGYRVIGTDRGRYTVTLEVLTPSGNRVVSILDRSPQSVGAHFVRWNGVDDTGAMVVPGDYMVKLEVYRDKKQLSLDTRPVKVIRLTEALFDIAKPGLDYGPVVAPLIRDDIVNKIRDEGILTLTSKGQPSFSSRPVTKVEFAVAIAKALVVLGADRSPPSVDFSAIYTDADTIPEYAKEYLSIYVTELGAGGTKFTQEFQPNKRVNRAEASILLTRLLNWRFTQDKPL